MPENEQPAATSRWRKAWPWINGGITAVLLVGGVWYLAKTMHFSDIQQAIAAADGRLIGLALLIFTLTGSLKAWRWRVLLAPTSDKDEAVPYTAVFWAIWLGQLINTVLPFLRLGEIGRAYAINQQIGYSKTQAVSTMLIEKSMEIIFLGFILLLLIPLAILPASAQQLGLVLGLTAALLLLGMTLVTFQTARVIGLLNVVLKRLPAKVAHWFNRQLIAGLKGLSALRSKRSLGSIVLASLLITLLDITIPYTLFHAFALPFGFTVAVLINVAVALVTTPPTAPGELGIFEAAVLFVLAQIGQEETAVIFSYALVFHLCTLIPKIVLGSLAAVRTRWQWRNLNPRQAGKSAA